MSIIKGRSIVLDDKVGIGYLFQLSIDKAFALLRGILATRRLVLIGRGTTVYASRQLFVEKGVEIGPYCQIDCLSHKGLFIGQCSKVGAFSTLKVSGTLADLGQSIVLGENVGIGEFAHIGGAGDVKVGSNTIAGAYLSIHPENHIFSDKEALIREQGVTRKGVDVGANCWIGAKVTILDGSVIGDGCVVAAGAVVNGIFPDNVVIGGVPAKILKVR
tara:strand:- start:7722 stop:8372 length:651 start_codon:yes stop_codon:yes gene_type:complete